MLRANRFRAVPRGTRPAQGQAYDGVSHDAYDGVSYDAYDGVSYDAYDGVSYDAYDGVSYDAYDGVSHDAYDEGSGPRVGTASSGRSLVPAEHWYPRGAYSPGPPSSTVPSVAAVLLSAKVQTIWASAAVGRSSG
jgi:hypothetical protein